VIQRIVARKFRRKEGEFLRCFDFGQLLDGLLLIQHGWRLRICESFLLHDSSNRNQFEEKIIQQFKVLRRALRA
jgi:hypothetical protein